ncbi:hypothetical protein ACS0TY_034976 [Phlomoides rotata]
MKDCNAYGQTVSMHFHAVLQCVSKLHNLFLVKPQPVAEDCSDPRWGKFMVITYFLPLYLLWNVLLGTESSSLPASSGARKARAPSLAGIRPVTLKLDVLKEIKVAPHYKSGLLV